MLNTDAVAGRSQLLQSHFAVGPATGKWDLRFWLTGVRIVNLLYGGDGR